jgi:hypothetical protein
MLTLRSYPRQAGFFDLGLSLVLLAVIGATAAVITTESEQEPLREIVSYSELAAE